MPNIWISIDEDHFDGLVETSRVAYIREQIEQYRRKTIDLDYIRAVKEKEGTLEVDESAVVSFGDDDGAYVMTWSWVSNEEAGVTDARVL